MKETNCYRAMNRNGEDFKIDEPNRNNYYQASCRMHVGKKAVETLCCY